MSPNRDDLVKWRKLATAGGILAMWALPEAIDAFLGVPPPKGNPGTLRDLAGVYRKIALDADRLQLDVNGVATGALPEVWVGQAREKASEVFCAVGHELDHSVTVCAKAHSELDNLAKAIEDAQGMHADAQDPLHRAKNELGGTFSFDKLERARDIAVVGMDLVIKGIDRAKGCAEQAAKQFADLAGQARASQLDSNALSSADRLVLANSAVPGGPNDVNLILTKHEAQRASSRLDDLGEAGRRRFDALLDGAKSPQEKAYLMKALAAGHPIDKIEAFDRLIHAHGDDPTWLRDHLTPIYNKTDETTGEEVPVTYGENGSEWTQGSHPTCVASSTVTARAMVDPLYALELTTGGHPDDPKFTSQEAFRQRLLDEQERVYGRPVDDGRKGMNNKEGLEAANDELRPAVGDYEHRDLDNDGDRRAVLADVERSVDDGKPVPVQVEETVDGKRSGHQMMIIAHEGNMLQIYNPWGQTFWVSEDDFVNGHMDTADGQIPRNVYGVHLPK